MFPPFLQLQSPSLELGPPKYFHFQEFLVFLNYKHLVVLSLVLEASLEASFSRYKNITMSQSRLIFLPNRLLLAVPGPDRMTGSDGTDLVK